jgi:tetratricopeptide (TPR) repeat protein
MFILVPLALIAISLLAIVVIVQRKLPYLRKLSPESHRVGEHPVEDYFPELVHWLKGIQWREYQQAILREVEKLLRRSRLVISKIDHISDRLIKKVRKIHLTNQLEYTAPLLLEKPVEDVVPQNTIAFMEPSMEDLKAREQQLIIEIAHDPKNAELYEILGDLYIKMQSSQDAKEAYEAALGFNPDNQVVARKYSVLLKKEETVH